jgi:hypothetical protein
MKKILTTIMMLSMVVAAAQAQTTPPSVLPWDQDTHYYGAHDFSFDLGDEGVLSGTLEFAVYADSQAQDMIEWSNYEGQADYVYAYQVFCDSTPDAGLTYFALTGIDPTTIADIQNDISQTGTLERPGAPVDSSGVEPISSDFNRDVTKAIWQFEDGTLVQGENDQSWFLLLYSDYDWIVGDIEVRPPGNDEEIPVPGVPEPATLALLLGGTVLSLRHKKRRA